MWTSEIYTLSLHDALPISDASSSDSSSTTESVPMGANASSSGIWSVRSEEHTSELQSRFDLVCRLLLEKKNDQTSTKNTKKNKSSKRKRGCESRRSRPNNI